jgi:hypothetical protein
MGLLMNEAPAWGARRGRRCLLHEGSSVKAGWHRFPYGQGVNRSYELVYVTRVLSVVAERRFPDASRNQNANEFRRTQ